MGKSSSRGSPGPNDRDSMQGGRMGPPKVIQRASMGNDSKPLHKAENAWMPSRKNTSADQAAKVLKILMPLRPLHLQQDTSNDIYI